MARILAFDFGTKRTGVAVTDQLQLVANPLKVLHETELIPFVKDYLSKEEVETIVIGQPRHLDGNLSGPIEAMENFVRFFANQFPKITVVRIDERFTSVMASRTILESGVSRKKRAVKENTDQIAAVLILQSYMEQLQFRRSRNET